MKTILALSVLLALAVSSPASAFGSLGARNDWSTLSTKRLQQLPPQISSAIREAEKACGDDEPRARSGFLRYLKARNGEEFISLHFDQIHCTRPSALCNSAGCLHRIFRSDGRQHVREVWHGQVHDIDMDADAGRPSVNIHCGDTCASRLRWNGKTFSK
jgi:hypothetical protein